METIERVYYPKIGKKYDHYKGGTYTVLTLAKHTETDEVLVIYKSEHFGSVHARPLSVWNGRIDKFTKRFVLSPNQ